MCRLTRFSILMFALSACKSIPVNRSSEIKAEGEGSATLTTSVITDEETYKSMSTEASGLAQAKRSIKFFIDRRDGTKPKIFFINGNYTGTCKVVNECNKFHFNFAREHLKVPESLEVFNKATYFSEPKKYVAGTLSTYDLPDKGLVYGIQFYPSDVVKEEIILDIAKSVQSALKIPGSQLAFVATGNQQTVVQVKEKLDAAKILTLSVETILGSTNFIPMHPGEAWGFLRLFPQDPDTLEASDIPVFDLLPLDLTVVAATITKAFQDTNSHINLKSKERNTPNMILRDAAPDHDVLGQWIDKPVHLKVTPKGWTIEGSTDAVVQAKTQRRGNQPWIALKWQPSKELLPYEAMCPGKPETCLQLSQVYGTKAANLGFLKEVFRDRKVAQMQPLTYDPVPVGFGVPLQFYKDLVDLPANASMKAKIEDLIVREKSGKLTTPERISLSAEVRQMILDSEIPKENLDAIIEMAKKVGGPITKWKLRSSANAEDIEAFNGAGLHDSYTGKLTKTDNPAHTCKLEFDEDDSPDELVKLKVKPQTFACAIKGVYAGLWNKRSIDERSYARLDHASVSMGLTILPSYDTESPIIGNSVVVTRVLNTEEFFGYSMSIQKDNNTVTNPTPGSWSEMDIVSMSVSPNEFPTLTTMRFAKPLASIPSLTDTVLGKQVTLEMALMVRKVEEAYCRANRKYYNGGDCGFVALDAKKPKALDLEFKVLKNGQFVVKQVREFGGK